MYSTRTRLINSTTTPFLVYSYRYVHICTVITHIRTCMFVPLISTVLLTVLTTSRTYYSYKKKERKVLFNTVQITIMHVCQTVPMYDSSCIPSSLYCCYYRVKYNNKLKIFTHSSSCYEY
jgi:hypothetical protein